MISFRIVSAAVVAACLAAQCVAAAAASGVKIAGWNAGAYTVRAGAGLSTLADWRRSTQAARKSPQRPPQA